MKRGTSGHHWIIESPSCSPGARLYWTGLHFQDGRPSVSYDLNHAVQFSSKDQAEFVNKMFGGPSNGKAKCYEWA